LLFYTKIDLKLRNKKYGPIHYKIGDTFVFSGYVSYTLM